MKKILIVLSLGLASPVFAQTQPPAATPAPLLEQGEEFARNLLGRLGGALGELSGYEAPMVLPNGDILIRKTPVIPEGMPTPGQGGKVDL